MIFAKQTNSYPNDSHKTISTGVNGLESHTTGFMTTSGNKVETLILSSDSHKAATLFKM